MKRQGGIQALISWEAIHHFLQGQALIIRRA